MTERYEHLSSEPIKGGVRVRYSVTSVQARDEVVEIGRTDDGRFVELRAGYAIALPPADARFLADALRREADEVEARANAGRG